MKGYFKQNRRVPNMVFFLVMGAVFAGIGVFAAFAVEGWRIAGWAVVGFGVLLAALPQAVIFARYRMKGSRVRYTKLGVVRTVDADKVGAAVLCAYDEYRRGKGFLPATVQSGDGRTIVLPALVLLKSVNEDELDMCDTRLNTRLSNRGQVIADMLLDFDFLRAFWASPFAGKMYVSAAMYAQFRAVLDDIFAGDGRVVVYERLPQVLAGKR